MADVGQVDFDATVHTTRHLGRFRAKQHRLRNYPGHPPKPLRRRLSKNQNTSAAPDRQLRKEKLANIRENDKAPKSGKKDHP